ncbi:hypothetical protein MHBO_004150, partial [Bonamia ostreae]
NIFSTNFYKFNTVFNDIETSICQEEVAKYLVSDQGLPNLLKILQISSVFDNMIFIKKKFGSHVYYQDNKWHYRFHIERKYSQIVYSLDRHLVSGFKERLSSNESPNLLTLISCLLLNLKENFKKLPKSEERLFDSNFRSDFDPISFHCCSTRIACNFVAVLLKNEIMDIETFRKIAETDANWNPLCLFEQNLRLVSAISQIEASMWTLNGVIML